MLIQVNNIQYKFMQFKHTNIIFIDSVVSMSIDLFTDQNIDLTTNRMINKITDKMTNRIKHNKSHDSN